MNEWTNFRKNWKRVVKVGDEKLDIIKKQTEKNTPVKRQPRPKKDDESGPKKVFKAADIEKIIIMKDNCIFINLLSIKSFSEKQFIYWSTLYSLTYVLSREFIMDRIQQSFHLLQKTH